MTVLVVEEAAFPAGAVVRGCRQQRLLPVRARAHLAVRRTTRDALPRSAGGQPRHQPGRPALPRWWWIRRRRRWISRRGLVGAGLLHRRRGLGARRQKSRPPEIATGSKGTGKSERGSRRPLQGKAIFVFSRADSSSGTAATSIHLCHGNATQQAGTGSLSFSWPHHQTPRHAAPA